MSTDTRVAYELRADYVDTFAGGLLRAGDRDLNIAELLEQGGGTIVVDAAATPLEVAILDDYPALKRVKAPEGEAATVSHADLTVRQLRDEAARRGMGGAASASKTALVQALDTDDARVAAGIDVPPTYTVEALGETDDLSDLGQPADGTPDGQEA